MGTLHTFVRAFLAVMVALALPLASPARADGPNSSGGAMHDPRPIRLTQHERAILSQKTAQLERSRKQRNAGEISPMWAVGAESNIYEEPQYQPWVSESQNWCGPGATSAVVSNWNTIPQNFSHPTYGSGGQGYLTWLAKEGVSGIGPMVVMYQGSPITFDTTLRATVNNQIGTTWYFIVADPNHVCGVCGLTNFQQYLFTDLGTYGRPLFTVVWSAGLAGWGSYGVAHYQWIVYASTDFDVLTYGDSAGANASPNGVPYGFHSWTMSSYYNSNVRNANVWDEIIW